MKYFKEIGIKNFFSFGPQEQKFDLTGNGIWNVTANNGFGKTALCIESLTFAIFGKTRQEKIDDVVNRQIGKNCKVSLTYIGDDDEEYKIIRYRKHDTHGNSVYLFKGDKDISCKNIRDTDALIQENVGMPYLAFVNSTIFSSELYSNFLSAKNSERLEIFENILSLKEINLFYLEAKNILKDLNSKEQEINLRYSAANTEKETLERNIAEYNDNAKKKLIELKTSKEAAIVSKEELQKQVDELSLVNVTEEKGKLANSKLMEEYKKQLKAYEDRFDVLMTDPDYPYDSANIKEKYKNFDFKENKEKELKAEKVKEEYSKVENDAYLKEKEVESLKEKVLTSDFKTKEMNQKEEQLNGELEKIKDSICPYCGQKMNEKETEEKKNTILKKIEDFKKEKKEFLDSLVKIGNEYDAAVKELKDLKEKIKSKPVIEFVPNSDLEEEKYKNACDKLDKYTEELQKQEKEKDDIAVARGELKEKISKLDVTKYSEEYLNSLSEKIEDCKEKIKSLDIEILSIEGSAKNVYDLKFVNNLKNNLKQKEQDSIDIKKEFDEVEDDVKYYKFLSEIFSNKSGGFKKYFIGKMIDAFNEKVNQYLPFFFGNDDFRIEFSQELVDKITLDKTEISFESLSCGQKTRSELAVAFALFSVSRVFFSNSSGLLIVDEMLDRGLDAKGIKSALSVLEAFANDTKVLVVSHNPILKDELENVIEIDKDENGFSYIKN